MKIKNQIIKLKGYTSQAKL